MAQEKLSLTEPFTVRGYWWLPDDPDDKVSGTLEFDPKEDFVLKLDGVLASGREFASHEVSKFDVEILIEKP